MKFLLFTICALIFTTQISHAYSSLGGFQDTNYQIITTKEAKRLPDNSYVKLKGNIVKRLTSDEYLFKDQTGTIEIEIDSEKWMGQTVNPNHVVEISGEIEKDFTSIQVEVDAIKLINDKKIP